MNPRAHFLTKGLPVALVLGSSPAVALTPSITGGNVAKGRWLQLFLIPSPISNGNVKRYQMAMFSILEKQHSGHRMHMGTIFINHTVTYKVTALYSLIKDLHRFHS